MKMTTGKGAALMENKTAQILTELRKAIIGKDDILIKVYMSILAGGHVLIEDVPGVGKTTLALAFSKALGLDFKRIQFTSDSVPSDITGFSVFDKSQNKFVYQKGAAMTNLLLADEINRTSSKTQSALLETMEENQVTVDGVSHPLPSPFIVLATQNPVGSAGTQTLPPSQMDRFMIKLEMGYPDFKSQVNILKDRHNENPLDLIQTVSSSQDILDIQNNVQNIHTDDEIYEYVTRLAEYSRSLESVELGISPRGALSVCRMAKAQAFVNGRDYVVPEDIRSVFCDVCAHRIVITQRAKLSGKNALSAALETLNNTPVPQIGIKGRKL